MKELIEKRTKLMHSLQEILGAANTEHRDMSPEEQTRFDAMTAEVDALDANIERQKKFSTLSERAGFPVNQPVAQTQTAEVKDESRAAFEHYLRTGETRALTVGVDANGGYLAPKEWANDLVKIVIEKSPFRDLATQITTSGRSINVPRKTSGPTGAWIAEGGSASSSQSSYGNVEIPLSMIRVFTDVSMEALNDVAYDIMSQISSDLTEEFARMEGAAFIVGDNSGKPSGITHSSSGIGYVASGTSADFNADNLIDLLYGLKQPYWNNATFVFSRATAKKIRKMKANNEYVWSPGGLGNVNNVTQGLGPTLLDRPYVICNDMPSTGTANAFSVAVGDFKSAYRVVTNPASNVMIRVDNYTQAANGLVRVYGFYRIGGATVNPEAAVLLKEAIS